MIRSKCKVLGIKKISLSVFFIFNVLQRYLYQRNSPSIILSQITYLRSDYNNLHYLATNISQGLNLMTLKTIINQRFSTYWLYLSSNF